jgi:nucleotide-binding universal stress UspA family protein
MTLLDIAGGAWLANAVVLALVMGRRGFDRFTWLLIGAVLGPLSVLVAVQRVRVSRGFRPELITAAAPERIGTDVLAGFDGSPESRAAIDRAVALLGPQLGRLTLVAVVPHDEGLELERQAREDLVAERRRLASVAPDAMVIRGRADQVLAEEARRGGYDVVVVGAKGAGRAHLFGSTARALASAGAVPVLIGDRGPAPSGAVDHDDALERTGR